MGRLSGNNGGNRFRAATISAIFATVATVAACGVAAEAGRSDGQPANTLNLLAFNATEPGWSSVLPAFAATPEGAGFTVAASFGASGDQAKVVLDGQPADVVNFADEPSVTQLVTAHKVAPDWNAGPDRGNPFGSVITLVVRQGNPRGIHDWHDLLQPGIEVICPNPTRVGSGKWALLAGYAAMSAGNKDPQAGMDYVRSLVLEHVKLGPTTLREATDAFNSGSGDVLITPEANAINLERQGKPVEHVTPPQTLRTDYLVAAVSGSAHPDVATRLVNFLYTAEAQRLWARAGFRPVQPEVAAEFAADFPTPPALWTIGDLGGWKQVDLRFFDRKNGTITRVFDQATQ
ncbi:extracellular solute-binding protein [Mycobacterium sp. MMS18-G62]